MEKTKFPWNGKDGWMDGWKDGKEWNQHYKSLIIPFLTRGGEGSKLTIMPRVSLEGTGARRQVTLAWVA